MAAAGEFIDECHRRILNLARVLRENDRSIEILESSNTQPASEIFAGFHKNRRIPSS
ncbi:hypothetical protein DPMN_048250 [Dreissena polymorpha]|uniref:Uncharacterized protein n=1 Tax=Dreissena polymorpha TaxID=45954 RepID=A0A9D4DAF9_DREPO|nr:hypothetical protein DPMN_048250 [Dreissena polymorpha]